jgi:2-dehydro-3-deoxyphosphogluconate aldolase/(4S)-4-hydroxy-2-oxoglutarate aldolase
MAHILEQNLVIPVITIDAADKAKRLAEALLDGGINIIEITLRTEAALDSVKEIKSAFPEMTVGVGTVISEEQAKQVIDSGSQFGLSPGIDAAIISLFAEASIPFVPGIMTPSEILRAIELEQQYLKFFPAGIVGGPVALKAISAPFAHFNLRFCPTGGVNATNMSDYLKLPNVFAVGGSWLATPKLINAGAWDQITKNAKAAVSAGQTP